ncbi:unnamed protein product [Malus baccata var. baccata]
MLKNERKVKYTNQLESKVCLFQTQASALSGYVILLQNNAVEASASDIDYEVVASKIQAGDCYEFMNFRTIKIRGQYKVMPRDTQLIFTSKTVFIILSAVFPPIL